MKTIINLFYISLSGMVLLCCKSPEALTTGVQTAGFSETGSTSKVRDTVLFHDTVRISITNVGDTVFVDRQQIRYVERLRTHTDTVTSFRSDTVRITARPEPTARSKLTDESRKGVNRIEKCSKIGNSSTSKTVTRMHQKW